jgi:hypothetical protein
MVVRTALVLAVVTVTVGVSPSPSGVPEEVKISPLPESYTISCAEPYATPVDIVVATLFVLPDTTEIVPEESRAKMLPLPESYARVPETEGTVAAGVSVEEALTIFAADNTKNAVINRTVIFQTLTFIDKFSPCYHLQVSRIWFLLKHLTFLYKR